MYNRYDNDLHPRETVLDSLSSIIDHNDSLQDHIKFLSSVSMFSRASKPCKNKRNLTSTCNLTKLPKLCFQVKVLGIEPLVSLGVLLPVIAPRRWGRFRERDFPVIERDEMRLYSQVNFGKQV